MKNLTYQYWIAAIWFSITISFNSQSQTILNSEDFESGNFPFSYWNDGGSDCRLDSSSILSGNDSANLQDGSGSSNMYTNDMDFSSYESVTITFDFRSTNFGNGDDLYIEFSDDSGSNWHSTDMLHYSRGTDFNNNTTYTGVTAIAINGSPYNFTSTSRLRFRVNADEDDEDLYIDNVVISYTNALDSDGDGIVDSIDIDDDNDGIIDIYECSAAISFSNASVLTASDLNDVKAGEKVVYSNALLYQNQYYDFVLTILTINGSFTVDCDGKLDVSSFNSSNDDYIAYSLDLVEAGSATTGNPVGIPATLYDIILELRDIDTSSGDDFTEIVGFNPSTVTSTVTSYLSSTTNLEQDGFINGPDPVGYTLYRLDPTIAGPTTDWEDEPDDGGTHGDDPDFYMYMEFDQFSHVDLLFGATGTYTTSERWAFFGVSSKCNFDDDAYLDTIDIDSDNDGIPDNVEAQPTIGYIPPSGVSASITDVNNNGLDDVYESAMGGTDLNSLEDTDGDGIKDYFDDDSDNDGTPDIEENGHPNTLSNLDVDNDGLDDNLDSITAYLDVNDEVTTGDVADLTASFGDVDSDATLGGDLDYRDLFDINPPTIASIDFDGIDDYLSRASFIDGLSDVTIMSWVKSDSGNSTDMIIAGEDTGCKLWLQNGNKPMFTIKSAGNSETVLGCSCANINYDEWHHITGTYTSATGVMAIYVNGEFIDSSNVGSSGAAIENTEDSNGNFEVGRLSTDDVANRLYFKGDIDEVRVFDIVLTEDQIQQIVYQEIQENSGSGNVQGTIVPKDVEDKTTNNTVPWANLIAYYPMTNIVMGRTSDYSGYDKELYINYITTIQDQTAPMPYESSNNGSWTSQSTWEHGDVWDIEVTATNKDWSIVKISSNVSASHSIKTCGLIIDSSQKLTIQGDNLVKNDWYLELNGTLDLEDDSQLIQTINSDLVTSADGKLLRRQEGTPSAFWYNYWASPVGATGVTALTDNNASTNNANNSDFKLDLLKDDSGSNCLFTSDYTGNGSISTYWLYTFKNAITYWDWARLTTSTNIEPGVGYTQKGTGIPDSEQQYTFEGKPNNGTILINVTDTGGTGSVPSVSKTQYLLGNPYASALDIHKFINDNVGIIGGDLLLWQQWSGDSHYLNEYNGGYAQVNKLGSIRAYQFVGIDGANNGSQDGTLVPSKYLPVGQGFITEIIANGNVEFNNDQRIFIKEDDYVDEEPYDTGSVFLKGNTKGKSENSSAKSNEIEVFKKVRLELSSVSGPATKRELLLGFSEITSDDYDYGYDAECTETNNNDFNLNFEGKNMNIQAYGDITDDKVVSLNFKSSGSNTFEIKMPSTENIDEDQEIYLKDNLTGEYFDLKNNQAYGFSSEQGVFNTRFEIVFQSEAQTLSIEEERHTENFIFYEQGRRRLYAKKLNASVDRLALVNMLGQTVLELQGVSKETLDDGLTISNVSTGSYVAYFRTELDEVLTKKIIIN